MDMRPIARDTPTRHLAWAALVSLAALAAVAVGWVGYIASDDALYWQGAMAWLEHPPSAGADHWATRFPLVLAFAAMLRVLGQGYPAFAATALLFYAVLVAMAGAFAARVAGARAGWVAMLLTATLPVVVGNATTVSVDLLEAAALLGGALVLADARGAGRGGLAGMLFGLAVLCRETSVLPLAGLALPFLLGRPVPRAALLGAAAGCAAVLAAEASYQYLLTGDPLRRWTIAFHHDSHIDRAANLEGNVLLWPPLDPLLVLLVNDDFGLLFWLLPPALASGAFRRLPVAGRRRLLVLAAMAGASFVLVAALHTKLVLNPRYFTLPALAAIVVVAAWADRLAMRRRMLLLGAMVGTNLLLLGVQNPYPRWPMEALVAATAAHPAEPVAGDPADVRRAALSLALAGGGRTVVAPAAPGGLEVVRADIRTTGRVVARYPSPPTRVGGVVRALGLAPLVPAPVARRLLAPAPGMLLIRRPG